MLQPKYITNIENLTHLTVEEKAALKKVSEKFVFRVNEYYLNLIDWSNPDDPLRKLVIPSGDELVEYGSWDASAENTNYVAKGCQHKYSTTALLLVSEICGAYCRYCFRKRLFKTDVKETVSDVSEGIDYIKKTPEINNVLLTGGDPFMLATKKLRWIIENVRSIEHVKIIRIGSKLLAFNPMRISEDEELLALLKEFSNEDKRIYVMAHINHPREITGETLKAVRSLHDAGVIIVNQTPILKGINNDSDTLSMLLDKLSWAGVTPYYFFINRPVAGNKSFVLPLEEVYHLVEEAKGKTSGLGKRVRLVMSHSTGKIEILAIKNGIAYVKYHQSRDHDYGKFMLFKCPENASWFDDLLPMNND